MDLAFEIFNKVFQLANPYSEQYEYFTSVWNRAEAGETPSTVLRMPTGYGKTEALVSPFLAQTVNRSWILAPRLIYVLPTQALCNQLFHRLSSYVNRVNAKFDTKLQCEIQHGGRSEDPYFIADIIITTFDQLLYGYARCMKHIEDRPDIPAGSIAMSYIILDEAHMYSAYTHALARALLEIFSSSGIPVALATATMPESLLKDLLKHIPQVIKHEYRGDNPLKRRITLEIINDYILHDGVQINNRIKEILEGCPKALIVCNTVDTAKSVYKQLVHIMGPKVTLVHSRYKHHDKDLREQEIVSILGKDGKENGIVISTQICEAGLDISADILITECAPADSIVQRSGRCARWKGSNGKIYIFKARIPEPYDANHISTTWNYLDNKKSLNFHSWQETSAFVNILPYYVDEVSARDSLDELYEATLYAESRPEELSARGENFITIALGDPLKRDESINIPFRTVAGNTRFKERALEKDSKGNLLAFNFYTRRWDKRRMLEPYQVYKGRVDSYDPEVGLTW